jgi:hypothetical protein
MVRPVPSRLGFGIHSAVCGYCSTRFTCECGELCTPEGKLRYFVPDRWVPGSTLPKLPEDRQFREMSADARLAIVYLILHCIREQMHELGQ